jgi:hypothetical protein
MGRGGVRLDEEEPYFDVVDLLINRYLLEELIASRLLRPTMLNQEDRVVIDVVSISSRARLLIESVIDGC